MGRTYLGYGCSAQSIDVWADRTNTWQKTTGWKKDKWDDPLSHLLGNNSSSQHDLNPCTCQSWVSLQQESFCSIPSPLCVKTNPVTSSWSWGLWLWKFKCLYKARNKSSNSRCHFRTWTLSQQKSKHLQVCHKSGNVFRKKNRVQSGNRSVLKRWSKCQVTIQTSLWPLLPAERAPPPSLIFWKISSSDKSVARILQKVARNCKNKSQTSYQRAYMRPFKDMRGSFFLLAKGRRTW